MNLESSVRSPAKRFTFSGDVVVAVDKVAASSKLVLSYNLAIISTASGLSGP